MATLESVSIPSAPGIQLAGLLHHPDDRSSHACVVVAHGMLSSKDSEKHRTICEAAAAAGTLALRFDFRGRGESDGDPSTLTVSNEIEDLTAVIAFVRDRGRSRVMVVGSSLGGTVALLVGAKNNELLGLVTIAAPARLPNRPRDAWGGSGQLNRDNQIEIAPGEFIDAGFFHDASHHDVEAAAHALACRWLIIHGTADPVVPVDDAILLSRRAPNADLVTHPTAGHRFDQIEERSWLIQRVAGFIATHI
jgi:pimeloyl-ACP methyl ester carboxylesterase